MAIGGKTMGGRIAEQIVSDDISTGAAGDIQQATGMARAMVCNWGMSEKLGMVQYGGDSEYVFLGREMARSKDYSEGTAEEIDMEVRRIAAPPEAKARADAETYGTIKLLADTEVSPEQRPESLPPGLSGKIVEARKDLPLFYTIALNDAKIL